MCGIMRPRGKSKRSPFSFSFFSWTFWEIRPLPLSFSSPSKVVARSPPQVRTPLRSDRLRVPAAVEKEEVNDTQKSLSRPTTFTRPTTRFYKPGGKRRSRGCVSSVEKRAKTFFQPNQPLLSLACNNGREIGEGCEEEEEKRKEGRHKSRRGGCDTAPALISPAIVSSFCRAFISAKVPESATDAAAEATARRIERNGSHHPPPRPDVGQAKIRSPHGQEAGKGRKKSARGSWKAP
jgi:hypothetical protein